MNRDGGLVARLDIAPAPLVVGGVLVAFTLALLAVVKLALPVWSLLLLFGIAAYVVAVLNSPVVGLLAVVAMFFLPTQIFGGVTLLQAAGAGTAALLLIWFLYQQRSIYFGNVLLPFLLLGVLILISFLFTRDATRSLMFFRKWAFNMLFAVLLLNLVTRFEVFKKVIWTVMIMAAVNAAAAVIDFATSSDWYYRSTGLLENANYLGHLAALAFPIALFQYLYRTGPVRWVGLGLAALLAGGVIASVSRGATLSLVLVFLVMLVRERRKILPLLFVLLLGLCAVPFLPKYFHERVGDLGADVKRSIFLSENRDLTSRGYLMSGGLKIWMKHPVLGVGMGNFGRYFVEREYNPGFRKRNPNVVPHNIYTQALAETGLVGAGLLAWLLIMALRNILRARQAARNDPDRWLYFGAVEMMALAVIISSAASGSLLRAEFWLFICLTAMSTRVAERGPDEQPLDDPPALAERG